ncbi:MAG: hypothetical protein KDB90_05170 [Planctomycetes bacterium]|nr:hypothetical protein [Planctomycetota bacterium]
MNRQQKKNWLKEVKARNKAARRASAAAKAEAEGQRAGSGAEADLPVAGASVSVETVAGPAGVSAPPGVDPVAADAALARAGLADARETVKHSHELTDDEARGMLVRAARLLDDVVVFTREALDMVPEDRRREAEAIVAEARTSRTAEGSPQKRPRRGADPVVTLMKVGMQAASLLKRVIGKTNPNMGKLRRAA